jgi:methyl-accepting chemotaxis protein
MTDEAKALVERLRALHVWPQAVADGYADLLTPRQIEKLYEVGRVSHEAADLIETQAREIERLTKALTRISNLSPAVTHGWAEEARQIARAALAGDSHDQ